MSFGHGIAIGVVIGIALTLFTSLLTELIVLGVLVVVAIYIGRRRWSNSHPPPGDTRSTMNTSL